MQILEIAEEDILDIYCPFCGSHSLGKEGAKEPCRHLQWVDCNETLGETSYKSDEFPSLVEGLEDEDLLEILHRRFPDDSTILFLLGGTFPEDPVVFIVYDCTR